MLIFLPCLSLTFVEVNKPLRWDKLMQIAPDANLQALGDAFQLQSLPPQNHLGAGGALRCHESGATLPLWVVWTYENTRPNQSQATAWTFEFYPKRGLGSETSSGSHSRSHEGQIDTMKSE